MQNAGHGGQVWNLGVIRMRCVNGMCLSGAGVACKRLPPVIVRLRVIGLPIVLDEILDKRIRARSVIGRIREVQDVLVRANRESFDFAELRVSQKLA